MVTECLLKKTFFLHYEWILLASGLLLMATLNPATNSGTLCLFHNIGIEFCPGCGLGRSVAYLFRGEFAASLQMHPGGVLAVIIIFSRIGQIFYRNHKYKQT